MLRPVYDWFDSKGWRPQAFQEQTWEVHLNGASGLIQVPTGSGKTYAAVMAPIAQMLVQDGEATGIQLLYITPLRALSRDLALALREPIEAMQWPLSVGIRNGDTSTSERNKQLKTPPQILITTPESLCVLLAGRHADRLFTGLKTVVLDEWHELIGSKRGTQTELAVSWLRHRNPTLQTWAISATIGNLPTAARHAVGTHAVPTLITGGAPRSLNVTSILPDSIDGFPWGGHLGLRVMRTWWGHWYRVSARCCSPTRVIRRNAGTSASATPALKWKDCWPCITAPWIAVIARRLRLM